MSPLFAPIHELEWCLLRALFFEGGKKNSQSGKAVASNAFYRVTLSFRVHFIWSCSPVFASSNLNCKALQRNTAK